MNIIYLTDHSHQYLLNIKEIYCSTTTWYWILRVSLRQILLINRPVSLMTAHSAAKLFRDLPERPPVKVDPEAIRTPTVSWYSATPKLSNLGFDLSSK